MHIEESYVDMCIVLLNGRVIPDSYLCSRKGTRLAQNHHPAFVGDVPFHEILGRCVSSAPFVRDGGDILGGGSV